MKPNPLSAIPIVAVLVWVAAIIVEPGDYEPASIALIGIGWLLLGTVGTVGLVLVGGRWAKWTLVVVLATTLIVSLSRALDWVSLVGLAATTTGLIVLLGPTRAPLARRLPSAMGPPVEAVLVILLGLAMPLAMGLVPYEPNTAVVVFAAVIPLLSFLYSRTVRGGLVAVRLGVPFVAIGAALLMPLPHGVTAVALAFAITYVAWSKEVSVAFRPPVERGSAYPIPPELVPKEILEGAQIDERGRRK